MKESANNTPVTLSTFSKTIPAWSRQTLVRAFFVCGSFTLCLALFEMHVIFRQNEVQASFFEKLLLHTIYVFTTVMSTWFVALKIKEKLDQYQFKTIVAIIVGINLLSHVFFTSFFTWLHHLVSYEAFILRNYFSDLLIGMIYGGLSTVIFLQYLHLQYLQLSFSQIDLTSQLSQLESRFQPSFFFNSLNGLRTLIHEDNDIAKKNIDNIVSFYHASLRQKGLVKLIDELLLCRQYLEIENVNKDARFLVKWGFKLQDKDYLRTDITIPSLLLQSFVEVFASQTRDYRHTNVILDIEIAFKDSHIYIRFFPEKALGLNSVVYNEKLVNALKTVIRHNEIRLQKSFGNAARITMENLDKEGCVLLKYPFITFD